MAIREALEGLLEASAAVEAYHKAHWVYRTLNPHSFFRGGASSHLWIFPPAAPERIDLPFKTVLGTPGYIAPEAWRPGKTAVRMDVYSLGAIAYAWVSGEHPFNDVDDVEEIRRLASQGPLPAPPGRGEEIPGPVVNLIRKCTEPHPLDRPRFAADVGRLVRDVLSDISRRQMARTAPEPPKSEKPAPERTREEEQDGEEKKPSRTTRVIPFSLDDIIDETESSS
jgi:serine/threonine protein kinase